MTHRDSKGPIVGRIEDSDGHPVVGALVRAFAVRSRDMELHEVEPLGSQVTDTDGHYSISWGPADHGGGAPPPNVRIAVFDGAGQELASSQVRFGIQGTEDIDLTLPNGSSWVSEFERSVETVAPLLEGVSMSDAEVEDVAFLIGTGIPAPNLEGSVDAQGDAANVARTLRLDVLTRGHVPMVEALQSRLQRVEESEGTLRPLASLTADEWLDLAYTHGTPDETVTPDAYADDLSAAIEAQYPTAALAAQLTDGRRLGQHPLLNEVGLFLADNPTFDIVTADVSAFIEQAELGHISDHEQLVDGLLALQRFNRLGATWDESASMLEKDISSPHDLLAAGTERLCTLLDGQIAPDRVMVLHGRAEHSSQRRPGSSESNSSDDTAD